MKKKDYSLVLYALILGICILASSCGSNDQITVKAHIVGKGTKYIVKVDRGILPQDTTVANIGSGSYRIVVDSIIPEK